VQLLRSRGYDQAKLDRALAAIEQGTKLQTQLIEDLLDVSRIISGKLRLDVQSVDMATVILAAAETVRPAAEAREQRLNVEVDPLAAHVAGDPARLRQVVWNLLSNAVKFTPQGGSVDVSLVAVPGGVEVVVRDTGRGIEPGFLPYVFDRFRQADSSVTREHGGLGLGLAIVRHIVEMHGGAVSVESGGLGCGATFRVRLSEAVREQVEPGEPADAASVRLDGVRVLLVEDRRDTRELVATMLEQFGATVVAVDGARAALAELDRSVPDVLVSDIGMHGGDGYSLIRAVRLRETARGGAVPAVALTAYAGPEDRIRAFAAGFHMHVPKPVEPLELALVVASLARG